MFLETQDIFGLFVNYWQCATDGINNNNVKKGGGLGLNKTVVIYYIFPSIRKFHYFLSIFFIYEDQL